MRADVAIERRSAGSWKGALPALFAGVVVFALVLCGGLAAGTVAAAGQGQAKELLWPPPPLTPRIKFIRTIKNQDDMGKGGLEFFVEALVGKKKDSDRLNQPMALAPSRDGQRLYVSDYYQRTVFVFDFANKKMSLLQAAGHPFKRPFGIAVDEGDNVYVVDTILKLVRVFNPKGEVLRDITHESLERPTGIAVDSARRRVYVADTSSRTSKNHVVHVFDISGKYLKAFGGIGTAEGRLHFPTYLALDKKGNVYVSDTMNSRVQAFDPEGNHLKTFGEHGDAVGMFDRPKGVALDAFGNVYVVDSTWSNVQIFNQRRQVLLYFAGRGRIPGLLFNPTGIAIDASNRIYVADAFNGRVSIYQLINTKAEDSFLAPPKALAKGGEAKTGERENPRNEQR